MPSAFRRTRAASPARQRIVAAARRHFLAHGFRGVTMEDLAQELGASKKTLYAHFPSKSALVEAVLRGKMDELEAEVERITAAGAGDFGTGLQDLLAAVQRHTEEIQPPFLRDLRREDPAVFQVVEERRGRMIRGHFARLLEAGRRQGRIRKDVPVPVIVEILLGAVQSIMNPPRLSELGLTPGSGFSAISTVVLEGALRPPRKASR